MVMGNAAKVAHLLESKIRTTPPTKIIDLGTGDGVFLLRLIEHLPKLPRKIELILLDQSEAVEKFVFEKLRGMGFALRLETSDAREWLKNLPEEKGTWVIANLFLHHFTDDQLRDAFAILSAKADLICACEPRRANLPLAASHLLWFIGANAVTRHDAVVSVKAGFTDHELSSLWPAGSDWQLHETRAGWSSHGFLATRKASA